ncbi:hypothetical protein PSPO_a2735 [Pseudoalteromonas spongiae UST010723-006]|nr:hypothetical protein PSPO_a2735 [Pseudoalteromonas spongiae UST010723-006]
MTITLIKSINSKQDFENALVAHFIEYGSTTTKLYLIAQS